MIGVIGVNWYQTVTLASVVLLVGEVASVLLGNVTHTPLEPDRHVVGVLLNPSPVPC